MVWTLGIVAVLVAGVSIYEFTVERLDSRRMEDQLARQVAEIAAHRDSQRAQSPVTPSSPTTDTPDAPGAEPVVWGTHWTDFRGPRRDGHYAERPIRTDWTAATIRPLWRQPVGAGHASFVIAGGRAFTIEQRGHQEVASAYDVLSGRELWTTKWNATFDEHYGSVGPRATPTFYKATVYALGATGELHALDAANGKIRWRTNILSDAGADNLQWGMAAAPLIVGDTVVVAPGGSNGRSVVAYDRHSGRVAWSALDDDAAYSSPMLVSFGGVEQIVILLATRIVGITRDSGALLWEFPWPTQSGINVAQPLVIGNDRVFVSSGYGVGGGLLQITREGERFSAREVWRTNRMKNAFTSSVHHEGFIYGMDEAILACIDAATGELKWKAGRYGHGQTLLASGHLVITTDTGELVLVRATPEGHRELARLPAVEGRTWNHPAMADGYLLVRNAAQMAAFDLRPPR